MGDNRFLYDLYIRKQEKNKIEDRKKENIEIKKENIYNMTTEETESYFDKKNSLYKFTKTSLEKKQAQMKALKKSEEVKKYIMVEASIEDMNTDLEMLSEELVILKQKMCNHELLYLTRFPKRTMAYAPNFMCLSCGKNIVGFLNHNQLCVNNDFLEETEKEYLGSYSEYTSLLLKNDELESLGLDEEDRYIKIYEEIKKKHKNPKRIELKRK